MYDELFELAKTDERVRRFLQVDSDYQQEQKRSYQQEQKQAYNQRLVDNLKPTQRENHETALFLRGLKGEITASGADLGDPPSIVNQFVEMQQKSSETKTRCEDKIALYEAELKRLRGY